VSVLGHDHMTTSARHRICLRCGTRETRRHLGIGVAWEEEMPKAATRGTGVISAHQEPARRF